MTAKQSAKTSAWCFDKRVSARYVRWGEIDATALAKHHQDLPDLEAACEPVDLAQPAFDEPEDDLDDDMDSEQEPEVAAP